MVTTIRPARHNDSMAFTPAPRGRSVQLSGSGLAARVSPDGLTEHGWWLEIGGLVQSHVDLAEPTTIRHEYLRRIATVLDGCRAPGRPLSVLHLGAGALTLPRYVQATRPGSPQVVVEIERELPDFVASALPLAPGTDLEIVIGDAREALAGMTGARFDAIVLDVFSGLDSPAHLACTEFYAEALDHLTEAGLLAVNVGDEPGLRFWAGQALALAEAAEQAGRPGVWTLADATLLERFGEGNLVLVAGPGIAPEQAEAWLAAGPHPAAVLDPDETEDLAERLA